MTIGRKLEMKKVQTMNYGFGEIRYGEMSYSEWKGTRAECHYQQGRRDAGLWVFVVGLAAIFAEGFTHSWGVMTFLGLGALLFSIESVVFSALSLKGAGGAVATIGVIGIALGFIGVYFSLKSLGVNIP